MNSNNIEYYLKSEDFKNINLEEFENDSSSDANTSYYNSSDTESNNSESDTESDNSESDNSESDNSESDNSESDNSESDNSGSSNDSSLTDETDNLFSSKLNGNEFCGEVFKNRYLIFKKLGYGSFSSVWMGYDIDNNSLVAIKIINPEDIKEGIFEIEIFEKIRKLNTTYLLTMLDYFKVKAIHYKYYENSDDSDDSDKSDKSKKLDKSDKSKKLDKSDKSKKLDKSDDIYHIVIILPLMACSAYDLFKCKEYKDGLPYKICLKITEQLLLGIKELEDNNIIHTDLKPENILICGLNREAEILLKLIESINISNYLSNVINKVKNQNLTKEELWTVKYKCYKKITTEIINFIKKDMDEIKEQMKICKISSEYLTDIKIKICDFNLVLDIDKNLNKAVQIQTRYYRAPEIILGSGLNAKSDYWSIGCILFELLTGDLLFEPEKNKVIKRDIHHLCLIQELTDIIPKKMLDKAKFYKNIYDDKNAEILNSKIKKWNLTDVFKENYDNLGLNEETINNICKFINLTLCIDPNNRSSINEMLNTLASIT
jgi:serine/threonine-protein kinase SRPK3